MSVCKGGFSNDATSTPRTSLAATGRRFTGIILYPGGKEISLAEAPKFAEAIINNQIQGRTLVKVN